MDKNVDERKFSPLVQKNCVVEELYTHHQKIMPFVVLRIWKY